MPTPALPIVVAVAAYLGAGNAAALGIGRAAAAPWLGQSLDLVVPLSLGDGETLEPTCVAATVHVGSSRLPSDRLQLRVEQTAPGLPARLRIRSVVPVLEPVVTVTTTLGCRGEVTRRQVLLVQPPTLARDLADAAAAPERTAAMTDAPVPASRPATGSAAQPAGGPRATVAPPAPTRDAGRRDPARVAPRRPPVTNASAPTEAPMRTRQAATAAASARGATAAAAAGREPHAQTRPPAELLPPSARRAAMPGLPPTPERPQVAEAAMSPSESPPTLLAALGFAGLSALGAWAWRWRRARQRVARVAAGATAAAPRSSFELPADEAAEPQAVDASVARVAPATPSYAAPALPAAVTWAETLPALAAPVDLAGPAVDEHAELDQQVDFFVVLGQDEAALELLRDRLRADGGLTPQPYLKMLEIYRRLGDHEAYARTRQRFCQRFNARVPDWDGAGATQRGLEDHADVLERLQRCWSTPLDALALLESLLYGSGNGQVAFDLPAYQDLLLLHQLARDLQRGSAGAVPTVDLLLPLGEPGAAEIAAGAAASGSPSPALPLAFDCNASPQGETLAALR